ncbi:MAG: hypothetical protein Q4C89_06955 [Deinococcus sp.]|uniref:hypothetical protein n=1 Tax=Deinococcus sp. TaxID=47478 RepID=UPI0026DD88C0|nr:hypothetical protein [Deinococcus sp.]MDO4245743.1 hypothetical protein [Deinococcus sp.]
MTLNADRLSQRLSWRGILAGLVMGVVTTLTLIALGTVITALTGLSLTGVGIAAAIWSAIAALVGAYAAGLVAVRASAPATHNSDGLAAMTHDDATLTGLVTAGLLILASTLFAVNSATRVLGAATNAATTVLSGAATTAAATGAAVAQDPNAQNVLGNLSQEDLEALIADNSPTLNREQVAATGNVVRGIIRRAQYDLGDQDLTTIVDFAKARTEYIQNALTGEQFVTRLTNQGLSDAQAREVQAAIGKTITRVENQAARVAQVAEDTARIAARNAGLGWLLASGLTILATVLGARSAATERRLPAVPAANVTVNTKPKR